MKMRFALGAMGAAIAVATPAPVLAAQACLANGNSYKLGEQACLTLPSQSHLARCEMVLNNTSWTTVKDECPGEAPKPRPTSVVTPTPDKTPTEPTAN
ncbi:hypothetical protein [Mesorhizobium sp.]|uniref:hypothetical protein n=1 Tax=Mesorhizobium sp. TaxID=1871066 RepID=UPI0025D0BCAE|nr:hypothetical protein [Mesorhizobium sp.]